jgi:putative transposase
MALRKVQYRLYPTSAQLAKIERATELHRCLYNAALEERIDAYRKARKSISLYEQQASLTVIRNDDPEYRALPRKAALVTLERLDLAFKAFFRRVKAGEAPGFPRFKSRDRFKGFGFRVHGDGARFIHGAEGKNGKLYILGIPGLIAARGRPRELGEVRTLEVSRNAGKWFLTISVECAPERSTGEPVFAFDWGTNRLLSGVDSDGEITLVENDRIGRRASRKIKVMARKLARQKRGSARRQKTKIRLACMNAALANQRKNRNHQLSARIVGGCSVLAFEQLSIANMTRSAKGTPDNHGKNVRQKAGLNREVLDTAPAQLMKMLRYKAEDAGIWVMEAPTRKMKPSQTCPECGWQEKKTLAQRVHECECGCIEDRDIASARVVLNWAIAEISREPSDRGGLALADPSNRGTSSNPA